MTKISDAIDLLEELQEEINELEEKLMKQDKMPRALSCWLSGHFEDCFRELESFLPDEWIGFADSVMKRMK